MIASILIFCGTSHCYVPRIRRGADLSTPNLGNGTSSASAGCGFAGNTDIYGVGIRIGYYSQTLATWFSNYFLLAEAKTLRSTNSLFIFALFIGLIWISRSTQPTYAIEAFLLLNLLFVIWYVGVFAKSKFSKKYWEFSPWRVFTSAATRTGMLGYNVWFWWAGLDQMAKTPCGTFALFLYKVDLFGWYRSAGKVMSIFSFCVGFGWYEVGHLIQLLLHLQENRTNEANYYITLREHLSSHGGDNGTTPSPDLHEVADQQGSISVAQTEDERTTPPASVTADTTSSPSQSPVNEQASQGEAPLEEVIVNCTQETSESEIVDKDDQVLPAQTSPDPPVLHAAVTINTDPPSQDANSRIKTSRQKDEEIHVPAFADLLDAERYLQCILDANELDHMAWCRKIPTPLGTINFFIPNIHSPRSMYHRMKGLQRRKPYRLAIIFPVLVHTGALHYYSPWRYLLMVETALQSQYHQQLSPLALNTILAFHTAQLPTHAPTGDLLFIIFTLAVLIYLILSIELPLYWNSIYSMGNVGAVGQLIPAIIGVGGLVKVLWKWWSKGNLSEQEEAAVGTELRKCAKAYEELKQQEEGLRDMRLQVRGYTT